MSASLVRTADVGAAPVMLSRPSQKGTEIVGETLSASPGSWDTPRLTFTYQWARNLTDISGATGATYRLQTADMGKTITVIVVTHKAGYDTTTKRSAATGTILGVRPISSAYPRISGTRQVGATLTASGDGEWNTPGLTFSRQWLSFDPKVDSARMPIPGETSLTYTIKASDVNKYIFFYVDAKLPGHADGRGSDATLVKIRPGNAPRSTTLPAIVGSAKVGAELFGTTGAWSAEGQTFSYQWSRGGTAIPDATHSIYKPVAADRGQALTVTVTAKRLGYLDGVATSVASGVVS